MRFRFSVYLGLVVGLLLILNSFSLQQKLRVLTFHELEPHFSFSNDTTYLINFWASWCKPCVEELPEIIRYFEDHRHEKMSLLLVSLDFPAQIETRLIPFIEKNNIRADVVVLDDPDFNEWINKVDPHWSGAIPATLIYRNHKRVFLEQTLTYAELDSIISRKIL